MENSKVVRAVREDEYRDFKLCRAHRASMVHMSGDLPPQQSMLQSLSEKVIEQTALIQQTSNDLSASLNHRMISVSSVTSLRQIWVPFCLPLLGIVNNFCSLAICHLYPCECGQLVTLFHYDNQKIHTNKSMNFFF